ncbi:hypothetical protein SSBR45G_43380 [Bradyrhizobium sp. SSBR45G]|nr:hypothetical protein [Bradyrhizobium sp. SSBR45G]GLH79429.1 hypothetical protein SSBR45G_43380 [Bradyrhizobium sp. SSBR45G]GLH86806.1 hypothetical protein SSBR45R_42660 [Bradyrhizobium sp. SSBR45R]
MARGGRCAIAGRWLGVIMALASLFTVVPVRAHHPRPSDGTLVGLAIPAIGHGEMQVVARHRSDILDLAARQARTDATLRRLMGFVSLQHFACWWGLVPGSLTDEASPFNECAHADMAGIRALLAHLSTMPGAQSAASALEARIAADIAADPAFAALCSNSSETFDSGVVIGPEWRLLPLHAPTVLTGLFLLALAAGGAWLLSRCLPPANRPASSGTR